MTLCYLITIALLFNFLHFWFATTIPNNAGIDMDKTESFPSKRKQHMALHILRVCPIPFDKQINHSWAMNSERLWDFLINVFPKPCLVAWWYFHLLVFTIIFIKTEEWFKHGYRWISNRSPMLVWCQGYEILKVLQTLIW